MSFINPFEITSPHTAVQELLRIRNQSTKIKLPESERKIEKLLEYSPMIYSTTQLVFLLENGILCTAHYSVPPDSQEPFLKDFTSTNLFQLKAEEKTKLVSDYEEALNKSDTMLILFFAVILRKRSLNDYNTYVALLTERLQLSGNPILNLLNSLPLSYVKNEKETEIRWQRTQSLIGRRVLLPWLELVKGLGDLYIFVPIDHNLLDWDSSAYHLLDKKANRFQEANDLYELVFQQNLPIVLQLYRLGRLVINERNSELILKYLRNIPISKLKSFNHNDLFRMGGSFSQVRVKEMIELVVNSLLRKIVSSSDTHSTYEELFYRWGMIYCFLSASSSLPHCVIDYQSRKSDFNVVKHLIEVVENQFAMNQSAVSRVVFDLIEALIDTNALRVNPSCSDSISDAVKFLLINQAEPLDSKGLKVFSKMETLRNKITSESESISRVYPLTTTNMSSSIVVVEKEKIDEVEFFPSSHYLIYSANERTYLYKHKKQVQSNQNDLSMLETTGLQEVLNDPGAGTLIKEVFSECKLRMMKLTIYPESGYKHLYLGNLTEKALEVFASKREDETDDEAEPAMVENVIKDISELFQPQIINLLQEFPAFFLSKEQVHILAKVAIASLNVDITEEDEKHLSSQVMRFVRDSNVFGKIAIERAIRDANQLRGEFNSISTIQETKRSSKAKKNSPTKSNADTIEAQLLSKQRHLTNLITFAIQMERALSSFIGIERPGYIETEYGTKSDQVVKERLDKLRSEKSNSMESILEQYHIRLQLGQKVGQIQFKQELNNGIPDLLYIKHHNPAYFELQENEICSLLTSDGKARFDKIALKEEEVVALARLMYTENLLFRDLFPILVHMSKAESQADLEVHHLVLRKALSEAVY